MSAAVELRSVRKAFGAFVAVDDLTVAVPAGTSFGLLGPNGAGKTTTIRMLMDILAPDSGEVLFAGRPRTREDLRQVGYLPEERGLYPKMTVTDQLAFLGELHGLPRRESLPRIAVWLERAGLADRARRRVEELSKGMQQKVQLIGTLLHEPELLILDEPFSGLDPINQGLFKELLAEHRAGGGTAIFSTHIMEHAEKLCEEICLIADGRVLLSGRLDEIKRRFGGNTYRLQGRGEMAAVEALPEVDSVVGDGEVHHLRLATGASGPAVLRRLVDLVEVERFQPEEPDLETIFVEAVRRG